MSKTTETKVEEWVYVYHKTHDQYLDSINKTGLLSLAQLPPEVAVYGKSRRLEIDQLIDREAPLFRPGFNRRNSIFAFVDPNSDWAAKTLKINVDPHKVLVAEMSYFSSVVTWAIDLGDDLKDLAEAQKYAQSYWKTAVTLAEYIKCGQNVFEFPEVIVPCPIEMSRVTLIR